MTKIAPRYTVEAHRNIFVVRMIKFTTRCGQGQPMGAYATRAEAEAWVAANL